MSGIYAQIHVKSGHGICTISRKGLAAQYSCQRTVKLWVIFMLSYRLLDKTTVLRLSWCTLLLLTIWLRLSSRNIATWCWILYCFPRRSWEGHHLPFPGFGYTWILLLQGRDSPQNAGFLQPIALWVKFWSKHLNLHLGLSEAHALLLLYR